jgi:hypothetical protein
MARETGNEARWGNDIRGREQQLALNANTTNDATNATAAATTKMAATGNNGDTPMDRKGDDPTEHK